MGVVFTKTLRGLETAETPRNNRPLGKIGLAENQSKGSMLNG